MKRPFIMLYINDFLSDEVVMLMDDEQFAWYMKLLFRAWKNEPPCKLLNNEESLMIAAGCRDVQKWREKSGLLMRKWKTCDRGKYLTNNRLQQEFDKMCAISDKRSTAAKAKQKQAIAEQVLLSDEQKSATQTQTQIHIEPKVKSQSSAFALPSWVPVIQWDAFMEIRKKKRAPNTAHALNLIVKKLDEFRGRGHPPTAVLDLAIERGWQSVFEPKVEGKSNHGKTEERNRGIEDATAEARRMRGLPARSVEVLRDATRPVPAGNGRGDAGEVSSRTIEGSFQESSGGPKRLQIPAEARGSDKADSESS